MERIKVSHVVLSGSEAPVLNDHKVATIQDADQTVQQYVWMMNMGHAKTYVTVFFEDGESAVFHCDYGERESVAREITHRHQNQYLPNKMPEWIKGFGESAVNRWETERAEWMQLIEKYDLGLGF